MAVKTCSVCVNVPGGHTGGATPVPIPNTEVKPSKADATAAVRQWESRTLPGYKKSPMIERSSGSCFFVSTAARTTFQDKTRRKRRLRVLSWQTAPPCSHPRPVWGPPLRAVGRPVRHATRRERCNPLAKTTGGALQSLVDLSALVVARIHFSFPTQPSLGGSPLHVVKSR